MTVIMRKNIIAAINLFFSAHVQIITFKLFVIQLLL